MEQPHKKGRILFEAFRCPVIRSAFRVRETSSEAFLFLLFEQTKGKSAARSSSTNASSDLSQRANAGGVDSGTIRGFRALPTCFIKPLFVVLSLHAHAETSSSLCCAHLSEGTFRGTGNVPCQMAGIPRKRSLIPPIESRRSRL